MTTMEVLTLLLVIFEALEFIDHITDRTCHWQLLRMLGNKEIASVALRKFRMLFLNSTSFTEGKSEISLPTASLYLLYTRPLVFTSALFNASSIQRIGLPIFFLHTHSAFPKSPAACYVYYDYSIVIPCPLYAYTVSHLGGSAMHSNHPDHDTMQYIQALEQEVAELRAENRRLEHTIEWMHDLIWQMLKERESRK